MYASVFLVAPKEDIIPELPSSGTIC